MKIVHGKLETESGQDDILTKKELWIIHAPSFNFELGKTALLKRALKVGFVTKVSDNQYKVNSDYQPGAR
tara:strand:+ start:722 stop:931 length:210 start_codon:yes stop_codon:yes gene_type:complete